MPLMCLGWWDSLGKDGEREGGREGGGGQGCKAVGKGGRREIDDDKVKVEREQYRGKILI